MITITNLSKSFGKTTVFAELCTKLENGQIYGLLGKNGAGKTTFINCILQFLKTDGGDISYSEIDQNTDIRSISGIVSDDLPMIGELSGRHNLEFAAGLYDIPKAEAEARIESLFNYFFENPDDAQKPLNDYSTGMKKKVMLISALLHKPRYLFLDEPFSGLDPIAVKQMLKFLSEYKRDDRMILISSHDLGYIEKVVDHIMVLNEGSFVFDGPLSQFTTEGSTLIDEALYSILMADERDSEEINWVFE